MKTEYSARKILFKTYFLTFRMDQMVDPFHLVLKSGMNRHVIPLQMMMVLRVFGALAQPFQVHALVKNKQKLYLQMYSNVTLMIAPPQEIPTIPIRKKQKS